MESGGTSRQSPRVHEAGEACSVSASLNQLRSGSGRVLLIPEQARQRVIQSLRKGCLIPPPRRLDSGDTRSGNGWVRPTVRVQLLSVLGSKRRYLGYFLFLSEALEAVA